MTEPHVIAWLSGCFRRFLPVWALLALLAASLRAAPLFHEGFEQGLPSDWTVSGSLSCDTVAMDREALEGVQTLRFSREPHLNRKDRAMAVAPSGWRTSKTAGIYELTAWVRLGNRTPQDSGQVSYDLYIQGLDAKGRTGPSVAFRTKRYNRDRTLRFANGEQARSEIVDFPVERWIKVSLYLDEPRRRWRCEVAPYGAPPIAAPDDLHWQDSGFTRLDRGAHSLLLRQPQ